MALSPTYLRVINWHYLNDSGLVPLADGNFFTGVNHSGKSTLFDAICTLLFVSKRHYNPTNEVSSSRKKSRDIVGYIRGLDNLSQVSEDETARKTYKRKVEKSCLSHIVMELQDSVTGDFFLIGVSFYLPENRVDAASVESTWWCLDKVHLADIHFFAESEGKKHALSLSKICANLTEEQVSGLRTFSTERLAKIEFSRLLRISSKRAGDYKDVEHLQKMMLQCIAFKSNVLQNSDQFVRNVVLEKKEGFSTAEWEEHLDKLQEMVTLLASIELKRNRLQEIIEIGDNFKEQSVKQRLLRNSISLIRTRILDEEIKNLDMRSDAAEVICKQKERDHQDVIGQIRALKEAKMRLEYSNQDIAQLAPLQLEIERKDKDVSDANAALLKLNQGYKQVKVLADKINLLVGSKIFQDSLVVRALAGDSLRLDELQSIVFEIDNAEEKIREFNADLSAQYDATLAKYRELADELNELKNGRVRPFAEANNLRNLICEEFKKNGIQESPAFLYELLDYKLPDWAFAAEAYMKKSVLFSIVVRPQYYKIAARILRDIETKEGKTRVAGVIIVDTESFADADIPTMENSLSSVFVCKSPFVQQYINYRYNRVKLSEDAIAPAKRSGTYLTKDGILYANRGVSRLVLPDFCIVGEEKRLEHISQVEHELQKCEQRRNTLVDQRQHLRMIHTLFSSPEIKNFRADSCQENYSLASRLSSLISSLDLLRKEYSKLTSSEPYFQMLDLEKKIKDLSDQEPKAYTAYTTALKEVTALNLELKHKQDELNCAEEVVIELGTSAPQYLDDAEKYLAELQSLHRKRSLGRLCDDISDELIACNKLLESCDKELQHKQEEYRNAEQSSLPTLGYSCMDEYVSLFHQISHDELHDIQNKTNRLNKQTSEIFRHQLLGTLKSDLDTARANLRALNSVLKNMAFNGHIFQFAKIKPAKGEKGDFFRVIDRLDSVNPMNLSLFSYDPYGHDMEEDARIIHTLFQRIKDGYAKSGEDWLDYRTYCEFGIDVIAADDWSRKSRLDDAADAFSGAEVQIPFYVILAASLVQCYAAGNRLTPENINKSNGLRLMMVDECFNRLDKPNIIRLVRFLKDRMGLQLIMAAPPDRFDSLSSVVENVIYAKSEGRTRNLFYFSSNEFREQIESGSIELTEDE